MKLILLSQMAFIAFTLAHSPVGNAVAQSAPSICQKTELLQYVRIHRLTPWQRVKSWIPRVAGVEEGVKNLKQEAILEFADGSSGSLRFATLSPDSFRIVVATAEGTFLDMTKTGAQFKGQVCGLEVVTRLSMEENKQIILAQTSATDPAYSVEFYWPVPKPSPDAKDLFLRFSIMNPEQQIVATIQPTAYYDAHVTDSDPHKRVDMVQMDMNEGKIDPRIAFGMTVQIYADAMEKSLVPKY